MNNRTETLNTLDSTSKMSYTDEEARKDREFIERLRTKERGYMIWTEPITEFFTSGMRAYLVVKPHEANSITLSNHIENATHFTKSQAEKFVSIWSHVLGLELHILLIA